MSIRFKKSTINFNNMQKKYVRSHQRTFLKIIHSFTIIFFYIIINLYNTWVTPCLLEAFSHRDFLPHALRGT